MKQFFINNFLIFLICMVVAGCGKTTEFVILRNVPDNPSFVIIPANSYMTEVTYANNIERAFLGSGAKVVLRPSTKNVTTESTIPNKEGESNYPTRVIEDYVRFDEIDADYLVQTYYTNRQVKVSKMDTREVLTVFVIQESPNEPAAKYRREIITRMLSQLGIAKKTGK